MSDLRSIIDRSLQNTEESCEESEKSKKKLDWEEQKARAERVEIEGRVKFFELREKWSRGIANWITFQIVSNIMLTFLVGWGCLNFKDYKWFITSVTIETFLQIVGMGYVAVKYLFSSGR
ncbi:hypothetical protein [Aristophania vespae]|uniref:hypothetical protein n=1 Tax=Aristophania vespae TaxID=2697033 RepID=UPI002351ABC2|nr:hypothetical protein [Aristophania vespae]UMM63148.1 hypothetical protein DM15PD_01030 [Aristophania vespae]